MHGLAVYVKEGLPFDGTYLKKTLQILTYVFEWLYSVSYFCFLHQSLSSSLRTVFYSIFCNINEILSVNPYANTFFFEDFNVRHKIWLTYSVGYDRPGKVCYNFFISNNFTQVVKRSYSDP